MKRAISVILLCSVIFISGCASTEYSGKGGMTEYDIKSEAYEYHYKHGYTGKDALEWDPDLQYAWSRVGAALTCNIEINQELIIKNMSEKFGNSEFIHEYNGVMFHHLQSKKIKNFCTKERITEIEKVIPQLEYGNFPHIGIASNYEPDLLFNTTDLKNIFEIDVDFDEKHILDRKDYYSDDTNIYVQKYMFHNFKGVRIDSTLMIAKEVSQAEKYYEDVHSEIVSGLTENGLNLKKDNNNSADDMSNFYTIYYAKNDKAVGNFLIIKVRNKVYSIAIVGAYFKSFNEFYNVFQGRLKEIFSKEPL